MIAFASGWIVSQRWRMRLTRGGWREEWLWFRRVPTSWDQAPPRVSDLATSTVFGSDPATEYLLTVRRTFSRSSMSISETWQSGYQGYIPATLWAVGIQFWYSRGYAYTFRWNEIPDPAVSCWFRDIFFRFRDALICQAAHVVTAPHCGTLSRVSASAELIIRVVLSDTPGDSMSRVSGHVPFASMSMGDASKYLTSTSIYPKKILGWYPWRSTLGEACLRRTWLPRIQVVRKCQGHSIADLQKMAVAEWLQSFNSVRGPMERLGIIWVPHTVSSCSSAHWKRTSGCQEIWRNLLISWEITGLAHNPLHALFRPKKNSQEVSLWVAMALRDSWKTRWLACKITGGNSQPIVRSWLVERPIRLHFYVGSSPLPPFPLQQPFFGAYQ